MSHIQWYPGHMTKTVRMMQTQLKLVDMIIELLDARVPESSRNPEIDKLAASKPRLIIFTKADLADANTTARWEAAMHRSGFFTLPMNLHGKKKSGIPKVMDAVQKIMAEKLERQRKKGRLAAPIRVMVVGIPNVGKSTFINMLAGRAVTKVADRPGVTRGRQWIAVRPPKGAPRGGFGGFDLLDTPGILWPKFEEQSVGIKLALTGAISDNILDRETLATHLLSLVDARYFTDRYKLQDNTPPTLDAIAHARGFKQKGNTPDILRTAITLIDEFRAGKLGRISLETPLTL